jgi:thioesterase domain-containing protein/acyl carrier protein
MSKKNVEAIYQLSPSQQGMLFETLAASGSGIHIEQSLWSLSGKLNITAFEQAWQLVVKRHSILRTCFVWQNQDEPFQVVLQEVKLPIEWQDWRNFSSTQQQEKLEDYLKTVRLNGFNLSKAPLIRLALFQTGEQAYQFVWTFHHILLDGWCIPLIAKETLTFYEAFSNDQDVVLEPACPYTNYITWLKQQDLSQAEAFWRKTLQGFIRPTPLGIETEPGSFSAQEKRYGEQKDRLPASATAVLQALVGQHHLTLSSLIQGVWALLLSRYSDNTEVLFGATVSGRPADLEGVETMIGFFINTVPVRIKIPPEASLWSWLQDIQTRNLAQQAFAYCSAGQIHQWSEMPGVLPLYESILVFENYPVDLSVLNSSDLTIDIYSSRFIGAQTKYALTMLVMPGSELEFQLVYDRSRFDDPSISLILKHFLALLTQISAVPEQRLVTLMDSIPAEQIPKVTPLQKRLRQNSQENFVLPRTPTEEILSAIWADTLGLEQVGIHDNFFELGGHSMIALSLMMKIQRQFGKSFPVTTFFQAPTIAQFAQLVSQHEMVKGFTPLVSIQPQGENLPFFCVHAVDGGVFYYNELSRQLGLKQPFYGLQASGLEPGTPILNCFEEMATKYVETLRAVHSQGPYLLGGYSFGGTLAYEMAQQLRRAGEQVALLALIDSPPAHIHLTLFEADFFGFMKSLGGLFNVDFFPFYCAIRGIPVNVGSEHIRRDLQELSQQERLRILGACAQQAGVLPPDMGAEYLERLISVFTANMEAARIYRIQPYQGRVVLFRSLHDLVQKLDDPTYGWRQYISTPIELYDISGDHFSIVRSPHVNMLAEKLGICLEQAQVDN